MDHSLGEVDVAPLEGEDFHHSHTCEQCGCDDREGWAGVSKQPVHLISGEEPLARFPGARALAGKQLVGWAGGDHVVAGCVAKDSSYCHPARSDCPCGCFELALLAMPLDKIVGRHRPDAPVAVFGDEMQHPMRLTGL